MASHLPATFATTRRPLLAITTTLLLDTSLPIRRAAAQQPTKRFDSPGLYRFTYPQTWALAYDRTRQQSQGTQVLVGDLREVDTLSVATYPRETYLQPGETELERAVAALVGEVQGSPASIRFAQVSSEPWGEGGRKVEYVVETCRGLVQEVLGGERECRGANDTLLQTIKRHHLLGLQEGGQGDLLVVNASATESRWPDVGLDVEAAFDSFSVSN